MSTLTVYSGTADGYMDGHSPTYATARSTMNSSNYAGMSNDAGQEYDGSNFDYMYSVFVFDLSSLPGGSTVSSAVLTVTTYEFDGTVAFTLEARQTTNTSWVTGASLSGLTLLAHIASSGLSASGSYALTSDGMAAACAAAAGSTLYVLMATDLMRLGTAPGSSGQNSSVGMDYAEMGGASRPTLVINYTAGIDRSPLIFCGRC